MPKRMNPTLLLIIPLALLAAAPLAHGAAGGATARRFTASPRVGPAANDREQDGLVGPVRRVKTETAKITVKNGKPVEGPRVVLETITYSNKGARIDSAYFLTAGGSLTGKEVYKYDDKGNMVEMTLHNEDGSLLAKEVYGYEFDSVGNWIKMTTAVAVVEGGKITFEPTEVTYRTIAYYLEEAMVAKMAQPAAQPTPAPPPATQPVPTQIAQANTAAASVPASPLTKRGAGAAGQKQAPAPANNSPQSAAKPVDQASNKPADKPVEKVADRVADNKGTDGGAAVPVVVASLNMGGGPATTTPPGSGSPDQPAAPPAKPDAEGSPRPAVRGPLKPVSGGILNGKALNLPAPQYPDMAKRARITGTVEVEVVIDPSGKVISAKAIKGPAMLQQAAEQAARQAKFLPTLLSGQPVKVSGVISYNFTLQ